MKDLTAFADIETILDPYKCPTAESQAEAKLSQDMFSLKTRTILSESTAISPAIQTIQERPWDESKATPQRRFTGSKKVESYNKIK